MDQQTAQLMMQLQEEIDGLWRYLGHGKAAEDARREAEKWRERTEELRRELESNMLKVSQQFSANMTASAVIGGVDPVSPDSRRLGLSTEADELAR